MQGAVEDSGRLREEKEDCGELLGDRRTVHSIYGRFLGRAEFNGLIFL